jgi:hypothetical protein
MKKSNGNKIIRKSQTKQMIDWFGSFFDEDARLG